LRAAYPALFFHGFTSTPQSVREVACVHAAKRCDGVLPIARQGIGKDPAALAQTAKALGRDLLNAPLKRYRRASGAGDPSGSFPWFRTLSSQPRRAYARQDQWRGQHNGSLPGCTAPK